MKLGLIIAAIVMVLIVVGILLGVIGTYNGLISSEENVDKNWAEIDNQLQRRADLIPNLVSTVKGYAAHEKEIFESVAEARSKLIGATGVTAKAEAAGALNSALGRLLAIAENYPNLKADTNFLRLQDELAGTENRISVARTRYNEAVQLFNAKIRRFPGVLFASMLGMEKKPYFEVEDDAVREVPKVEF